MTGVRTGQWRRRVAAFAYRQMRAVLCVLMAAAIVVSPSPARAECSNCGAVMIAHGATSAIISVMHQFTRNAIDQLMEEHKQRFMIDIVFAQWIQGGMGSIIHQLTAAGMGQVMMIGAFLDAEEQLQRQMLLQELTARAHKDYHPSMQMCAIGTSARGLGSSAANAELAAFALAQHAQDRQLHGANTGASGGTGADKAGRLDLFVARYCDAYDNNYEAGIGGGLTGFCSDARPATAKQASNRDVQAGRLFNNIVYKARYDGAGIERDDPDLFALANNLYAHDTINPIAETLLSGPDPEDITANQDILLDIRAVVAKRSVAMDSFNQIAGMRTMDSAGASAASPYMAALLQTMGYSARDAALAVDTHPSYDTRMELLTKKMYMEPEFYTNLYDKPANVARARAAMRAIGLVQDMDLFKSRLRNEMSLSVLLELEIEKEQERVGNRLKGLEGQR